MFFLFNKYRFLCLFIILISFCLFKAIHAQLGYFERVEVIFALLIFSNLFIIGHKERLLILFIGLIILMVITLHILALYFPPLIVDALRISMVVLFFMLMAYLCLYYTGQDKTISVTTIFGSICTYFFIGLVFAYIDLLIKLLSPGSFSGLESGNESQGIYFSFITLTTVGFGEIIPLKPIAQTITWLESFCGQLYIAVIIGQMIGRYVADQQRTL